MDVYTKSTMRRDEAISSVTLIVVLLVLILIVFINEMLSGQALHILIEKLNFSTEFVPMGHKHLPEGLTRCQYVNCVK